MLLPANKAGEVLHTLQPIGIGDRFATHISDMESVIVDVAYWKLAPYYVAVAFDSEWTAHMVALSVAAQAVARAVYDRCQPLYNVKQKLDSRRAKSPGELTPDVPLLLYSVNQATCASSAIA